MKSEVAGTKGAAAATAADSRRTAAAAGAALAVYEMRNLEAEREDIPPLYLYRCCWVTAKPPGRQHPVPPAASAAAIHCPQGRR